jgi:hypothetical protein
MPRINNLKTNDLDKIFEQVPGARKVADGYILGDENAQFHIFGVCTSEELEGLEQNETFYLPFCTKEEILRIRYQKTSSDYLLWLRAEAIADCPRAVRVFRKRAKLKKDWSLTKYYNDTYTYAKDYISLAGKNFQERVAKIPSGMAFINEVNAMCIRSKFGNVIVVNEALSYFLHYMNLAFFGSELGIKSEDTSAALAIAVRIMLGSEAMDFDLDPRGTPPAEIHEKITAYTNMQLMFTFGHEYSHHTLNHLQKGSEKEIRLDSFSNIESGNSSITIYNYNHKKEYEADLQAIKNIKNNNYVRSCLADSAFLLFIYFDILDHVYQVLSIRQEVSIMHPRPLDRLWRLRRKLKDKIGATKEIIDSYLKEANSIKDVLSKEWIPYRIEQLERYGSVYLPSYKGKILIDREDF